MVDTIYIEQQVRAHPRTEQIVSRYPKASIIDIEKYSEVFNRAGQNFRLQKNNPSLILAAKKNNKVLSTPSQYETGGGANYYFSHMLNCLYDCRYCFLQGMYRSANYLLFVNYEDFLDDIRQLVAKHQKDSKPAWFFSGYDCDSLAYEPLTQFADVFMSAFAELPNAVLELRTKSTQIRSLLARAPQDNVVVAYSLSPPKVAQAIEQGAPSFDKRLQALAALQQQGWRIGIRFDPMIWHADYQQHYGDAFEQLFTILDANKIDSITLGGFRLPMDFYKKIRQLYPEHWLFAAGLNRPSKANNNMLCYQASIEEEMLNWAKKQLLEHCDKLYVYHSVDNGLTEQRA